MINYKEQIICLPSPEEQYKSLSSSIVCLDTLSLNATACKAHIQSLISCSEFAEK